MYSGSDDVQINIRRDSNSVALRVQDHGRGIEAKKLTAINDGVAGVGMRGMKDRVRQLNGQMKVESATYGTTISITLPLPMDVARFDQKERGRATSADPASTGTVRTPLPK